MLRLLTIMTILAGAIAAVACDPFAPDLGTTPYRCATGDPKCPEGYDETMVGQPAVCVCHLHGAVDTVDASSCQNDDGSEPNDTFATARATPVGNGTDNVSFHMYQICNLLDVDSFAFNGTAPNQKITATLQFNAAVGQLSVRVVDQSGLMIGTTMASGTAIVAQATLATTGRYYVQVTSLNGSNTYDLTLKLQ